MVYTCSQRNFSNSPLFERTVFDNKQVYEIIVYEISEHLKALSNSFENNDNYVYELPYI